MTHHSPAPAALHDQMANCIRFLAADAVQAAKSGHPGMPMGMADVATVLFTRFMTFDAADPTWPDRDRFVLSAGHGSMLIYALAYLTGMPGMDIDDLKNFRQLGSKTAGHPEYGHAPGIEVTTGPLGQGIATSVGMALGERMGAATYGADLVDHHTYVIAGDGCLMEGVSHEAISLAGHLKLGRLIVLWDDNSISIDGPTDLSVSDDQLARFAGQRLGDDPRGRPRPRGRRRRHRRRPEHRPAQPDRLSHHHRQGRAHQAGHRRHPRRAAGRRGNRRSARGRRLDPAALRTAGRGAGRLACRRHTRGRGAQGLGRPPGGRRARDPRGAPASAVRCPAAGWDEALKAHIAKLIEDKPKVATRVASQKALEALVPGCPRWLAARPT